jgi:hypothetical protein
MPRGAGSRTGRVLAGLIVLMALVVSGAFAVPARAAPLMSGSVTTYLAADTHALDADTDCPSLPCQHHDGERGGGCMACGCHMSSVWLPPHAPALAPVMVVLPAYRHPASPRLDDFRVAPTLPPPRHSI